MLFFSEGQLGSTSERLKGLIKNIDITKAKLLGLRVVDKIYEK